MRRKVKSLAAPTPLRKAAMSATAASRRASFPAWIDADERGVTFSAAIVVPRVRDALVLRTVGRKKSSKSRSPHDARRSR